MYLSVATDAGTFCEVKLDVGGLFPAVLVTFFRCTSAPDLSPTRLAQRDAQREVALIATPLNAARSGRGASPGCPVLSLPLNAKDLLSELMRLYVEIGDVELTTREPLRSAPSPAALTAVGGPAPKKAKMVHGALAGFVMLQRKDVPTT